eukprot:679058-Amphidinium_carterae.1
MASSATQASTACKLARVIHCGGFNGWQALGCEGHLTQTVPYLARIVLARDSPPPPTNIRM